VAIVVDCPHCSEKLNIKDEYAGRKGKCPKCQKPFTVPGTPAEAGRSTVVLTKSTTKQAAETVRAASATHVLTKAPVNRDQVRQQVLAAISSKMTPPQVSLGRKLGILLVLGVVVLLPLFYIAVFAGLVYGIYWLLTSSYAAQLSPTVVWVAIAGAAIFLVCMLKPLIEPRRRTIAVHPLTKEKQDLLAEFVGQICEQIDAPRPAVIQTECSARLAAESRRMLMGLLHRDVVLTMGLPLVACLSVEQLAGLVAGQMAQFRRRAGSGSTNTIRAINGWLWRSVYEDGQFDAWLRRVAERRHFHLAKLLLPLRAIKLFAQMALFVPMFIGNTVASSLVRRVELDADRAGARLVGKETFAGALVRLGLIEFTWQGVIAELDYLHKNQQLPDSLPKQLALRMLDMTPELCAALRETVGKPEEKPFDSRPSEPERLEAIQAEPPKGVLDCKLPAPALLAEYESTAEKVTWDYYLPIYGARLLKEAMVPVNLPAAAAAQ
jgi:Zn-dependent protease with chaperone function